MKYIYSVALLAMSTLSFAQVAIGKSDVSSADVSLEFADFDTNGKGIILPWVEAEPADAVAGTIIYDLATKKVKLKTGASTWRDLSQRTGTVSAADLQVQSGLTELANAKVIIGANQTDSTPGILVLSDDNKAMVLPKMASPHLNIKNPTAGTMAYDTATKQLCVFNGEVWTFWKA